VFLVFTHHTTHSPSILPFIPLPQMREGIFYNNI
jgi:hypothetical protein